MKIKTALISALALTLFSACSNTSNSTPTSVNSTHANTHNVNMKTLHKAIMQGAEDAGWIATEFKTNEVIAEKIDGEDSIVVSVKIIDGRVHYLQEGEEVTSDIDDLEDAISEAIHSKTSSH